MKILDATTGFKGIWYQKNHPFVTFMDKRKEKLLSNHTTGKRTININPDIVSEWKDSPFPDNYFDMIIFDPPHLVIKNRDTKPSTLQKSYGVLYEDTWMEELRVGINKLFNILKPNGIFILKWCENSKRIEEIFKLCPYKPLFGSNTKSKGHTQNFWVLFIKNKFDGELTNYIQNTQEELHANNEQS